MLSLYFGAIKTKLKKLFIKNQLKTSIKNM